MTYACVSGNLEGGGVVTIVLLIGVVNFGLGFALAVYLRHSPDVDLFMPRFGALGLHVPLPRVSLRSLFARRDNQQPVDVPADADAPSSCATCDKPIDERPDAPSLAPEDAPQVSRPDGRSLDELLAATTALVDSVATEFGPVASPAVGARRVPKVLGALLSDAKRIRAELVGIEDSLRTRLANADDRPLDLLIAQYQRVNSDWSRRLFADAAGLHAALTSTADEQEIVRGVEDCLFDQAAQIAEMCRDREPLGLAEVRAECRRLLRDVGELTELSHVLRDRLVAGLRQVNAGVGGAAAETLDELTGLPNLAGLEAWLMKWRETLDAEPSVAAPAVAAIIDVDRFRLVNERIGHRGCDRMLAALARLFEELFRQDGVPGIVARTAGATFVLVWEGRSVADATASVERMRQSLEAATFDCGEMESTITVSGAVCSLIAATTTTALLQRLQTTLVTAKRAGRNRTCAEAETGTGCQIVTPMRMEITGRTLTLHPGVAI